MLHKSLSAYPLEILIHVVFRFPIPAIRKRLQLALTRSRCSAEG